MPGDRVTDDARARYARGLLISRIGGLAGTIGFVTLVAVGEQVGGSVTGGLLLLVSMATIHVGGLIQGEASAFLAAWTHPDQEG
jgi:hypothetical protein